MKPIFESKDKSINVQVGFEWSRFLVGLAFARMPFVKGIQIKMVAVHLGPVTFTFSHIFAP